MGNTKKRGLTWKGTTIIILLLSVVGGYLILKVNPPLEVNTILSSEDDTVAVIGVGNKGFMGLKVEEVLVNNEEKPAETTLQIASAEQGFILTNDETNAEAEGHRFVELDEEMVKIGTTFEQAYAEDGAALEGAEIYGVNIEHDEAIHTVIIQYRHFGITYEETVNF